MDRCWELRFHIDSRENIALFVPTNLWLSAPITFFLHEVFFLSFPQVRNLFGSASPDCSVSGLVSISLVEAHWADFDTWDVSSLCSWTNNYGCACVILQRDGKRVWRDAEHPHFPFNDPYWPTMIQLQRASTRYTIWVGALKEHATYDLTKIKKMIRILIALFLLLPKTNCIKKKK